MQDKAFILGVDAGTTVVKTSVFDVEGTHIASASQKVPIQSPQPGWAQQDMHEVWDAAATTIREAIAESGIPPQQIAVVSACGQGDGAWMLDAQHEPVCPAPLWNDARAADIIQRWEADGILADLYPRNGTVMWPGTQAALLVWVRDNRPEDFARIHAVMSCKDWIKFRLTDVICTDETDGSIPFMNLAARAYDDYQLDRIGLAECRHLLPRVTQSHDVIGSVTPAAAQQTGLAAGTPVVSGMMDVNANAIGTGAIHDGQCFTILGTTGINCMILSEPNFEPADVGASACHSVPGTWLRLLGAMAGTPNLDWYVDNMGEVFRMEAGSDDVFSQIESAIAPIPAGSGGVLFHPFLRGERAPFLEPAATGGFFGVTVDTTRAQLARAVYEGIAFSVKHCYSQMGTVGRVVLAGGGAGSHAWCQILADMLNCEVVVPEGEQFGTLGAALAGAVGVGIYPDYAAATAQCVKIARRYTPQQDNVATYDVLFPLYTQLIESMQGFWRERQHALSNLASHNQGK